jgi:hypothetical protein
MRVESTGPAHAVRRRAVALLLRVVTVVAMATGASGCLVANLWPLYGDDSILFDEALLGTWENPEDQQTLRLERDEWRSYAVSWSEGTVARTATAHLTGVGQERFLDLMPETGEDRGALLLPVHVICRVRLEEGNLQLEVLDYTWLAAPARQSLFPPGGVVKGQREELLLTLPTERLRRWVQRISAMPGAFLPPRVFVRTKPAEARRVSPPARQSPRAPGQASPRSGPA